MGLCFKKDDEDKYYYYDVADDTRFEDEWFIFPILNDEVEIIEEDKKIEKIPYKFNLEYTNWEDKEIFKEGMNTTINEIYEKINEIIDKLNEGDK